MEPRTGHGRTVIVSAGFHMGHINLAAREASDRGLLALAITSVYPTHRLKRALEWLRLTERGRLARLLERDVGLPQSDTRALFLPELVWEAAKLLARLPFAGRLIHVAYLFALSLYGRLAGLAIRGAPESAGVYHFRAGFGKSSIDAARRRGLHVMCDHAIAHPTVLEQLVANGGRLAPISSGARPDDPIERAFLADIERSDSILVNSDFAKETYLAAGWPAGAIHVVYLGVDDAFLADIPEGPPPRDPEAARGTLRMLFAGRLEPRKGADTLIEALQSLAGVDWELVIAGPVVPSVWSRHEQFLSGDRVTLAGTLPRQELMRLMRSIPIFVFPSLAEGSARVVFEALACGAYVITTPNAGSIVEDGVHGALVAPGRPDELRSAIAHAAQVPDRVEVIRASNAALIARQYRQEHYGLALESLYDRLLTDQSDV